MYLNTFIHYLYTFLSRFATNAYCKPTIFHSCLFCLSLAFCLLLSFSFVILGSSLRGSSLDQWLVVHFIGHYITFSHMYYLYKWSVVSTKSFFPCGDSPVHLMSLLSGSGGCSTYTWRGTVRLQIFLRRRVYVLCCSHWGCFLCPISWLLWGLLLGVCYQSIGLK